MRLIFAGSAVLAIVLVTPGFSQTPAPSKPGDPLAVIDGQPVYEKDLALDVTSKLLQLHSQEYQIKSKALDDLIEKRLLDAEARKRGVSSDKLLQDEVDSKIPDPTKAEVEGYYLAVRNEINQPFEKVETQLQKAVKLLAIAEARQDYVKSLRANNDVRVLLSPPKVDIAYDSARVRGDPRAPVTIVEFSDFQCPYCKKAQATLKALLEKYNGQAKLAFRDFPMRNLHPQAEIAAEAGRCAQEQGKFWKFHDALFSGESTLDVAGLEATAKRLGLNESAFDSCLTSGKFKADVDRDLQDGTRAGVAGTPAFFINGQFVNGAQPEADFAKIIDRELAAEAGRNSAQASR